VFIWYVHFSGFGITYQEKSGNPELHMYVKKLSQKVCERFSLGLIQLERAHARRHAKGHYRHRFEPDCQVNPFPKLNLDRCGRDPVTSGSATSQNGDSCHKNRLRFSVPTLGEFFSEKIARNSPK
jgi:hypothetical protein